MKLPTVDELNDIQRQWMALDSTGPKKEIDRVCKLMEQYPSAYVSGHDGLWVASVSGTPLNQPHGDLEWCKQMVLRHPGGRVDVVWHGGRGEWYRICPHCDGSHPSGCCAQDGHGG